MVESTTDEYFVLYVRHELDADTTLWMPVSVTLGGAGTTTVAENVEALPKERYRVDKYSVACPADVDGDGIDDITELADPVGMNPVNPAAAIDFGDGAVAVPDWETFDTLSSSGFSLKFVMLGTDTDRPRVYFQNTKTHSIHLDFLDAVGIEPGTDGLLRGEVAYGPELVAPDGSQGVYYYRLKTYYRGFFSLAALSHTLIAASMPVLEDNLAYYIPKFALPYYQSDLPLYRESRINLLFDEDIFPETRFLALNPGEGYGRLRVMEADERPNPRDVVIYEALPNELPRVAGIISTVPQTPLSHVNLRAVQDGIPNAFIRSALDEPAIESLLGGYVRYEVTERGWTLRAATRAEVDAHYASSRPAVKQTPQRDLSVTEITALSEVGFDDWDAFGVKAANVAVLGTLDFPAGTVPDGFAVPFYFYDEFMKANDLYDDIATMLADTDFQTDFDTQEKELKKLRKKIKKGETPDWIITALEEMHGEFPEGTSLRYRSSTNNEDLPGFNGAGLYDSKTQHPEETEEDGIAKSLKQVYASLWNFRAFTEREFYRVDHLAAAMGVLVHPNYSDELVNGVAVSFDPITGRDGYYYVNSQIGEDLVTNPEAHSVPEEILLYRVDRYLRYDVLGTSNQAEPGQLLMSRDQLGQLRRHLAVIHEEFAELYGVGPGEQFAMEIEFKITSENILAIKQARPWVFEGAPTAAPPGDAMLNALTLSDVTLAFASTTTEYTANVANGVDETTVRATANDDGASYVVKLGGVTDADGVIPLAVGSNVITIEVTAEDGDTAKTYTVTVTRAETASGPAATIELSPSGSVAEGTEVTVTMSFGGLERDSDPNDVDYIFRADVVSRADGNSADICEGKGIGSNRNFNQVDEDPEVRTGTVSASCTPGDYTVEVSVSSSGNVELASATADFTVNAPGQQQQPEPPSTDATLSNLALSSVYFGAFYPATTEYNASVANGVDETTVTPTVNDDGATYAIKLGGVTDADGVVPLTVGGNVITVEVTAEDGNTAKTYTVTVTRAAQPPSTDATLRSLELNGVPFTFASDTTSYDVNVANGVDETTVNPTTNDAGASYVVKLGGVTDADGTVSLVVGSNVITIEVTAEDRNATRTYTVTVTRGASSASGPAVAIALSPSGPVEEGTEVTVTMSFGGLERDLDRNDVDYIFRADVKNSANGNADGCEDQKGGYGLGVERYMKQVDENPEVRTGTISADCPAGEYTLEVSISSAKNTELASASAEFTVNAPGQEQQPEPPSTDATLRGLALSDVALAFDPATTEYSASVANDVDETTVTPTVNHDGATYAIKLGGVTDADGVIPLAVGSNVITVEVTAEDGNTAKTYTVTMTRVEPPSTDATLSNLTLSGINIGPFDPATTEYNASVANGVDETTVTPTTNDGGAIYAIKLGGVAHADGIIPLAVGGNVITIEVTAEDGNTAKTYTVTVTRAEPLSTDATLSGLELSGIDFGAFDPATTGYTASVANGVDETTVTPTTNDGGAIYAIKLGGVAHADGTVELSVGSNVITVEVTAEDGNTTKTYTVTVTRAEQPVSGPAVAVALSPSGPVEEGTEVTVTMSFGGLERDSDPGDVDYIFRADVKNSASGNADDCEDQERGYGLGVDRYMKQVDENPEVRTGNISASCAPGDYTVKVSVSSPSNIELATATADFTVNAPGQQQPEPPSSDATLNSLALSGVYFGAFDSATTGYTANVANGVDETTVTPTVNDDGATYAIKLGGVTDADGVIPLAVGSNVITVEVTAEDGNTAKTYTVTTTRAEPPSTDATLSNLTLSGINIGPFDSATTEYNASVANDVDETTVTPTANDGGASYVVKLGDEVDEDGTVELSAGANAVTVVVTAEDGKTTKTYTVTVNRDAPPEPVEPEPESTGERSAWLESNPENKPFVGEWQHFTLRGSGLDKVDLQVNVIGFDGAPGSTGAVGYATASPPPAVGEVCGDAYYSGYQMSVDATFSLVGCREGTVVIELLDPGNDWALLKRYTVTVNAGP